MKKFLSLILALTLCAGLAIPASAAGFSDVPADHWANEPINRAVADGIVGGYQDGTFRPASAVSYGAFSLMLARAFYPGELAAYPNGGTQAGEAIMNRHNILNGTGRASKSSGADLPREDMAQCMYNVLVDKGAKIPSVQEQSAHISSIPDYTNVSYSCRTGVLVCYALGLLGGQSDGNFGPKNSMNRAQGCVVINRLRDYFQNNGGTTTPVTPPEQPETPVDPPVEPTPTEPTTPTVTELPEFKMLAGEDARQMMKRINDATPAWREGYLSNGKPITEENIQEFLSKAEAAMPHRTVWQGKEEGGTKFLYYSPAFGGYFGNAYGCNSFGACLSDAIFGEDAPLTRHQNFDQLKVGDVVWMKNTENGYSHVFLITSIDHSSGRYTICSGNHGGEVEWGRSGPLSTFDKPSVASGTYVYSRY